MFITGKGKKLHKAEKHLSRRETITLLLQGMKYQQQLRRQFLNQEIRLLDLPNKCRKLENSPVGPPVDKDQADVPMLLRSSQFTEDLLAVGCDIGEFYRILSHHKVLELFNMDNKACADHRSCPGNFSWDNDAERKWGLCWSMGVKCTTCSFRTGPHKWYYEIPSQGRGRKAVHQYNSLSGQYCTHRSRLWQIFLWFVNSLGW